MQSAVREVASLMSPASSMPVGVEGAVKAALATSLGLVIGVSSRKRRLTASCFLAWV
jgi:hypothetical protein